MTSSSLIPSADSHHQSRSPLAHIEWQAHEDSERNDLKRSGHKLSDSEQSNPWKCKNVYDSHIEEDELEIFGSFDSEVDVDVCGTFPEYSAPSSPYNVDASRRFDVENDDSDYVLDSPTSPSSTLTSPGIPIWEDDWFKWRSRDECDSDNDEDEVENKKMSKGSDFGGGPEDGLRLKCNMVWVL